MDRYSVLQIQALWKLWSIYVVCNFAQWDALHMCVLTNALVVTLIFSQEELDLQHGIIIFWKTYLCNFLYIYGLKLSTSFTKSHCSIKGNENQVKSSLGCQLSYRLRTWLSLSEKHARFRNTYTSTTILAEIVYILAIK